MSMLQTASDIDELEQIARQTDIRVNTRSKRIARGWGGGRFGWSAPPNIERAKAAHVVKEPLAAKESPVAEKPAPVIQLFTGANVTCYAELIDAIRTRVGALGVRYQDFDDLAGWAAGLSGKVFGPSEVKRLGPEKMFDALRAAGLRIRVEEDLEQTAKMTCRIAERFNPRQANQARPGNSANLSNKFIDSVLDYLTNKKGGIARLNKAVKQAHSNHARRTIAIGVNWAQRRSLQHISEETLPVLRGGSKYG
jgi:hypothetical protein